MTTAKPTKALAKARVISRAKQKTARNMLLSSLILVLGFAAILMSMGRAEANDVAPNPGLWKLSDEDSEVWLFGTVHILNPTLKWRNEAIDQAFLGADIFYSEAPVVEADETVMKPLIAKYGVNHTGTSFLTRLSAQGSVDLNTTIKTLGLPETIKQQFAVYRPWLAGVTLGALQVQSRGGDPEAGVDKILWREAKVIGKDLRYFETMEQQISLFGGMSMADELAFFESGLRQMIEDPDLLDEVTLDWQAGRVEALGEKLNGAMVGQAGLKTLLLDDRNKSWARDIKKLMDGAGTAFIAVGAGHLAGEGSLQDQLATLGLHAKRQ